MRTDIFNGRHENAKPIAANIPVPPIFETFVSLHYFIPIWSE